MQQFDEKHQIIFEMAGEQKISAHAFPAIFSKFLGELALGEQLLNPIGRAVYGVNQNAILLVGDLRGNTAHGPGDDGLAFP